MRKKAVEFERIAASPAGDDETFLLQREVMLFNIDLEDQKTE